MQSLDRRYGYRLPLEIYLNSYVGDRPSRGYTSNVSETGLYLNTVTHEPLAPHTPIGLEFALPGMNDTIWAAGELCYDEVEDYMNGSGIRFVAMAGLHERMLREYLKEARRQRWLHPRRPLM